MSIVNQSVVLASLVASMLSVTACSKSDTSPTTAATVEALPQRWPNSGTPDLRPFYNRTLHARLVYEPTQTWHTDEDTSGDIKYYTLVFLDDSHYLGDGKVHGTYKLDKKSRISMTDDQGNDVLEGPVGIRVYEGGVQISDPASDYSSDSFAPLYI